VHRLGYGSFDEEETYLGPLVPDAQLEVLVADHSDGFRHFSSFPFDRHLAVVYPWMPGSNDYDLGNVQHLHLKHAAYAERTIEAVKSGTLSISFLSATLVDYSGGPSNNRADLETLRDEGIEVICMDNDDSTSLIYPSFVNYLETRDKQKLGGSSKEI
jgi:hypothetical protein